MKRVMYRYVNCGETILCVELPVLRETPKGKWVDEYGISKFVLNDSHKRYAHETKINALVSFIARKTRQLGILKAQHDVTVSVLAAAKANTPEQLDAVFHADTDLFS